jgi:archaeosine-15-forming tRNA-guanine transglycosylase
VTESESVVPQTVEEQNHKANVFDEFVVNVDQNCGPEEDVQKESGLRVVIHDSVESVVNQHGRWRMLDDLVILLLRKTW